MKQSVYILACMAFACMFNSCGGNKFISSSGLHSAHFQQKVDGEKTCLYRIYNKNGVEACITNYGARVVSLMVPDRNGKMEDVVCGFSDINSYTSQSQNYGATVGRYIGRILHARYTMNGKEYHLQANHADGHTAHGGNRISVHECGKPDKPLPRLLH